MTYTGKLYMRLGGVFVATGWHTSDVDELTASVKRLETENTQLRQAVKAASHISVENKRLSDRDCNAKIELCYNDGNNPFSRESLRVIDVGVADNIYVVESETVKRLTTETCDTCNPDKACPARYLGRGQRCNEWEAQ